MPAKDNQNRPLPFAPEECHSEVARYVVNFIEQAPYRHRKGGNWVCKLPLSGITKTFSNIIEILSAWSPQKHPLHFANLTAPLVDRFIRWLLDEKQFSANHAGRLVTTFKSLALDAKRNGLKVHPAIRTVTGFSQSPQDRVINILTFSYLEKLKLLGSLNIWTTPAAG